MVGIQIFFSSKTICTTWNGSQVVFLHRWQLYVSSTCSISLLKVFYQLSKSLTLSLSTFIFNFYFCSSQFYFEVGKSHQWTKEENKVLLRIFQRSIQSASIVTFSNSPKHLSCLMCIKTKTLLVASYLRRLEESHQILPLNFDLQV